MNLGRIEVNCLAYIRLIFEAKFGRDSLHNITSY